MIPKDSEAKNVPLTQFNLPHGPLYFNFVKPPDKHVCFRKKQSFVYVLPSVPQTSCRVKGHGAHVRHCTTIT